MQMSLRPLLGTPASRLVHWPRSTVRIGESSEPVNVVPEVNRELVPSGYLTGRSTAVCRTEMRCGITCSTSSHRYLWDRPEPELVPSLVAVEADGCTLAPTLRLLLRMVPVPQIRTMHKSSCLSMVSLPEKIFIRPTLLHQRASPSLRWRLPHRLVRQHQRWRRRVPARPLLQQFQLRGIRLPSFASRIISM